MLSSIIIPYQSLDPILNKLLQESDNRENTIVSIITYTKNRFTCYAKKVCINLSDSMHACLI